MRNLRRRWTAFAEIAAPVKVALSVTMVPSRVEVITQLAALNITNWRS
jgi:hypothetical protein